jgi:N-acetyltransferase
LLHGQQVSLVPLSHAHHDNLTNALKDGELWTLWYTSIPTLDQLRAEIDRRLELHKQGSMLPFAVIEKSTNEAVGMTTFLNIDAVNRRVEIGQNRTLNAENQWTAMNYWRRRLFRRS